MLKVFLAEDEFVVREGIKNNIDWSAHGYNFCGEAGDGELAYSMIRKEMPDIVITDIKMPFMDGLTLSRMIKAEFPEIEIILLTGYEDFEYAKEAIKIGVASYLSKPISGDSLLKEIGVVARRIEERKQEQEIARKYREDMKERTELERQDFFQSLVTGDRTLPYLLEKGKELSVDLSALCYNIVILKVWSLKHEADEFSGSVLKVQEGIADIAAKHGAEIFELNLEGNAILFKGDGEVAVADNIKSCIEELKQLFSEYPNIRYFGGVGQSVERITDIPTSFEWASRAFAHQYLSSDSDFLFGSEEGLHSQKENVILSEIDPRHIDRRLVKEFLRRGEPSEVEFFLDEFLEGMGKNAIRSTMLRQYISMDIYFCVADFIENDLGLSRADTQARIPAAELLADEKNTYDYLVDLISTALDLRQENSKGRYRDVVSQVMAYIDAHYSEEELSLNTLAAHVNFSPNHLSAVFRQATGQTFIKYLTDYRLDKAKELLLTTSKKSNEIGMLVGYKDPHYFSYLFKKTQGMTTTQYRAGSAGEGTE
ncbi:response regulator transcription factor [Butyrivibrio sp. FCS014]|uniref:response regulator transcription factor n=1 Tax=Butyrivibrio sp. FCS014 TaxID=1408304 RepID=UPI0004658D2C|nr:response regulator [Butyrivibrio sp. FCS014]